MWVLLLPCECCRYRLDHNPYRSEFGFPSDAQILMELSQLHSTQTPGLIVSISIQKTAVFVASTCTQDEPARPLLFGSTTRPLGTWKSIKKVVIKVATYQEERQGVK